MRKGISILFALIMVLSGTHFTLAKHFCGGELVDTKISLSGKLGSCGMESDNKGNITTGNEIKTHCCDNNVSTIAIINNYIPEAAKINMNINYQSFPIHLSVNLLFCPQITINNISENIRPPGAFPTTLVTLNDICVFRI